MHCHHDINGIFWMIQCCSYCCSVFIVFPHELCIMSTVSVAELVLNTGGEDVLDGIGSVCTPGYN